MSRTRIDVRSGVGTYPVHVGPGAIADLPDVLGGHATSSHLALISDDRVAPLHGASCAAVLRDAGYHVSEFSFPAGEASKTRKSWSILTDQIMDAGLGRDGCVVAVGGGVTTDLAGFVAATYLRGVPVLQVPTSYLAMIDASVGGKTGVDVKSGKNLVGAFHAPLAVVADTEVLATLPDKERRQGLVEAFKHGAILDETHFERLRADLAPLLSADAAVAHDAVVASVHLKARVVEEDEFEGGYRKILNFGHTMGHAIEAASGYALGHGSAVALGMLAEAEIGERIGVSVEGTRSRLHEGLGALALAVPDTIDPEAALVYLNVDKKAVAGRPRFVLLEQIGCVATGEGWTHEVPDALVREVMIGVLQRS